MDIDLISPDFKANPYPVFSWLRSNAPIYQVTMKSGRQVWIVTRYEDAETALRDPRLVRDERNALSPEEIAHQAGWQTAQTFLGRHMLTSDPPVHTRLRSLVSASFAPRSVEQWRGRIQAISDELLDAVQVRGEMDLIDEFGAPLAAIVIAELLGVPSSERMQFRVWSDQVMEAVGNPDAHAKSRDSINAFRDYLHHLILRKRERPADDLLSKLLCAEAEGDKLSESELISMVYILLLAGNETSVNLVGNGILALLQHPEQLKKLRQDPSLMKTAIDEFLRYQGPLLSAGQRWASEDVELNGQLIPRGASVIVLLASANRDENEFERAEELDLAREENRHLAFGKGIHYCLGAPLARIEGQVAIGTILRRMPNLRLAIDPQALTWRPGLLLMGLSRLPVRF